MEYQKTNINAFGGLDNNSRPELIKNEEASDIENLRFEKLGYLINRNGVVNKGVNLSRQLSIADRNGVLWGIGTMGLSEYIITKPWGPGSGTQSWPPYDDAHVNALNPTIVGNKFTDRFMVYSLRIPSSYGVLPGTDRNNNSAITGVNPALDNNINRYTWRYKAVYLLVPLTGPDNWRDTFAFAPNGNELSTPSYEPRDQYMPTLYATIGARSILRADDKPSRLQIYAPSRWLGVHNVFTADGTAKDLNWIEHYVSMNQYRDALVISDMTNGDMLLVDEYSEAEYAETKRHRFTLRENALAKFDIDDVVVDFGIGGSNFNEQGIESPMALYKFYLQRSRSQPTQDNFIPYYTAFDDASPQVLKYSGDLKRWSIQPTSAFITMEYWKGEFDADYVFGSSLRNACGIAINDRFQYLFNSQNEADEYDDLLKPLTLQNPAIKSDDQVSADVYLWEDQKIKYYPVSGKEQGIYVLRALDREWDKSSSGGTKLIELTTKAGVEQKVPLGVWRYRFVWYLGNGEYSAPSAELVVPDLIFSAVKDSAITSSLGSYKRPFGVSSFDEAEQSTYVSSLWYNQTARIQGVKIFDDITGEPSAYGESFIAVKKLLYDAIHPFAAKYSTTNGASWPTSWTGQEVLAKNQLGVSVTMYWPNGSAVLSGVIAETAMSDLLSDGGSGATSYYPYEKTNSYTATTLSMNVPLFRDVGAGTPTYNSVFSDYGFLRTAYQNTVRNSGSGLYNTQWPAYQVVLEGAQKWGAEDDPINGNDGRGWVGSDVIQQGGKIWFNLVPFRGGVINTNLINPLLGSNLVEQNNFPDADVIPPITGTRRAHEYRNMTVLRGVKKEVDRLAFIKPNIPAEVTSRLILSGTGELVLCDYGDNGTIVSEKTFSFPPGYLQGDYLEHSDVRTYYGYPSSDNFALDTDAFPGQTTFSYIKAPTESSQIRFRNLKVLLSGNGERLALPEQLSMYIPASLLFDAPHVKLYIPANRVPRRARQLLIFRTRASHDNAWQPHEYGLVKSVDIIRNGTTNALSGAQATGIEFLDNVKSSELDYSYVVPDYDGFVEPVKSRFCLPLNERVFYANIKEGYKPHAPRNSVKIETIDAGDTTVISHKNKNVGADTSLERLWSYKVFGPADYAPNTSEPQVPNTVNIVGNYLYYFVAYSDQARSFSLASFSGEINRNGAKNKVVLFGLPSAYDPSVECLNIYRLSLANPLSSTKVQFNPITGTPSRYRSSTRITSGVYLVAQGLVEYNGVVYYPNSIIQAAYGGDVGYDPVVLNYMWSYFQYDTATDRGHASSYCQPIVYDITTYFDQAAGPSYIEKIGTVKPEAEGIFYDDDLPSLGRLPLKQFFQNEDHMPSALRWSEPYQPNKIKLPSLMEVRAGDGDQITGMAMLYGNLIILKERSMHRLAVQGAAVPVSRVDEISNNVGCIAPNTVITVNNTLYFLSWSGFYRYDNNVLSKIDGKFAEELQLRLRSAQSGVSNPAIRDASCGWNAAYRELYLNIPIMTTQNNEGDYDPDNAASRIGISLADNKGERVVRGIIYAINIDTGLVTKHRYMDDSVYFTDPSTWMLKEYPLPPTQRAPRVYSRLYYTNSLGQMRSADTLPPRTNSYFRVAPPLAATASLDFMRSSAFIESPTKDNLNRDRPTDDFLIYAQDPITQAISIASTTKFIRVFWASKDWTAEDKSVLKRIRKVFAYISASDDPAVLRGITHTSPTGVTATVDTAWQYSYIDSRLLSPRLNYSVTGEVMAVPTESAGLATSPSQNRGERYTFNVEGSGSFQMEYFGFYWKPINQYER